MFEEKSFPLLGVSACLAPSWHVAGTTVEGMTQTEQQATKAKEHRLRRRAKNQGIDAWKIRTGRSVMQPPGGVWFVQGPWMAQRSSRPSMDEPVIWGTHERPGLTVDQLEAALDDPALAEEYRRTGWRVIVSDVKTAAVRYVPAWMEK